jgi:hypothetical protein
MVYRKVILSFAKNAAQICTVLGNCVDLQGKKNFGKVQNMLSKTFGKVQNMPSKTFGKVQRPIKSEKICDENCMIICLIGSKKRKDE